jgi:hypothetical protein
MKDGAVRSTSDQATKLLVAFGKAVGTRPFDLDGIRQAGKQVEEIMGEGGLIEAACSAGGMEMATRVVDSTGKKKPSDLSLSIGSFIASLLRWIKSIFYYWYR